jgi:AbrB family looped-hinge helix DNA binding protein
MPITKMTKKGQITIPAEFRKKLKSEYFSVEMEGNQIVIKPVKNLAGALKRYASKDKINKESEAFKEATIEKYTNN